MNITPKALQILKSKIEASEPHQSGIRISVIPGCCTPKPILDTADTPHENEMSFSIEGIDFYIDKQVEPLISGYTLDYNANGFKLDLLFPQGRCCK